MATYVREPRGVGFSAAGTFGGILAAIGMLALIAGTVTAIGAAVGVDVDFTETEWRAIGWGGVAALAAALFLSFLFGGYIAGRMALGSGTRNGLWVFVGGLIIFGVAWLLTWALVDAGTIAEAVEDADIPTGGDVWTDIGIGAAIAAGLAMLLGGLLGGLAGARWRPPTVLTDAGYAEDAVDVRDRPGHSRERELDTDGFDPARQPSVEEERELTRHGRNH